MAKTFQYDPANVAFNVGGQDTTGFAGGTFIKVARNKEAFETVVGSDGEGTRVKSPNLSGTMTVTLNQSSPSNDYFSALATSDEQSSTGFRSIYITDKNGTTKITAATAWVKKKPDTEFSDANTTREWQFESANIQFTVGGETSIG